MHSRKPRPKEQPLSPGAKLVWSDEKNQLVLQLPKGASPPPPPSKPQPSPSIAMLDQVLAGAREAGKQA